MKSNQNFNKFILDFTPIILFFLAYKFPLFGLKPIIFASLVGFLATILSLLYSKIKKIKLEKLTLYSNLAFVLFSGLTVVFDNPDFVKAKLSILNGFLGLLLLFFYFKKRPVISKLFAGKIEMEDIKWNVLNLRLSLMFLAISILNFYFWKFTPESTWVNFKTFGVLPFIFAFFVLQIRFIIKNSKKY